MKALRAVATLMVVTLLAGCGPEDVRGSYERDEIQFGIWQPDDDGAMRFTATADVPNVDVPNVIVSEDGRTATTVGIEVPDGGYLSNSWKPR